MRVMISAEGANEPDLHYMVVDGHGLLLDLDGLRLSAINPGSLTDPTIARVTWGPVVVNGEAREGGTIHRQDGSRQAFFDRELLKPYLAAFASKRIELARAQAEYDEQRP